MSETTKTSAASERKKEWYTLRGIHKCAEQVDTKLRAAMNSLDVPPGGEVKHLQSTVNSIVHFAAVWHTNLRNESRNRSFSETEISGDFVDNFRTALNAVNNTFIESATTSPPAKVATHIRKAAVDQERDIRVAFDAFLRSLAEFAVDASIDEIPPLNVKEIESCRKELGVDRMADEARIARDRAVKAARDSEEAAGHSGTSRLSLHFGERARHEARQANLFRIVTIVVLIVLTVMTSYWVFAAVPSSQSIVKDLTKLVITIPLGILAAYMSRESSRHRAYSVWSRDIEIQLRTLEAYINPLPDFEKNQLRAEFGKRVFGTSSAVTTESSQESLPQIGEFIAKMGEVIKPRPSK